MTHLPDPGPGIVTPPKYQVFPAIGIARVGNSRAHSYIATESPQIDHVPAGGYRGDPEETGQTVPQPTTGGVTPAAPTDILIRKIKRMGCRFRIFEFNDIGQAVGEIDARNADVEWTVQLVNKKAAGPADWGYGNRSGNLNPGPDLSRYILDTGPASISGTDAGPVDLEATMLAGTPGETTVQLGTVTTDVIGRLVVYGGFGETGSWLPTPPDPVDVRNPGWWDDTSDGIIRATVTKDGERHEALAARIVVGPPDYAHPCLAPVTLYDLAYDRLNRDVSSTSFQHDIHPLLHRAAWLEWTLFAIEATQWGRSPKHGHGYTGNHDMHPDGAFLDPAVFATLHDKASDIGTSRRGMYAAYLKDPSGGVPPGGPGENFSMPAIEGLTFTPTQYAHFQRFAAKAFDADWPEDQDPCTLDQPSLNLVPMADKPTVVNRAAMDFAVGGPFFPGVEVGAVTAEAATYVRAGNLQIGADMRVDEATIFAGDLTATLALPWQCGMNQHNYRSAGGTDDADNLWPSARPVLVPAKSNGTTDDLRWTRPNSPDPRNDIFARQRMVTNQLMIDTWHRLGFLTPAKSYVETDRTLSEDQTSTM